MPYIGRSEKFGVRNRFYYTQSSGGATSISGADDAGKTLTFTDGAYVDVFLNGIALVAGTDYNTTTADTIAGLSALSNGDVIEVLVYDVFNVADTVSASSGGTFSGGVTMGGTLSVTGESTATGGLNVGTIKEATGTTTAMTIDSTGRILTPARPAFRAVLGTATAGQDYTTQQLMPVDTEKFDIGDNFDLSTKEFVAPIAGIYQFNGIMAFGGAAGSGSVALYLYKNDVIESDTNAQISSDDPNGGGQVSLSYSGCLQLAANDKIEFQFVVNNDSSSNINAAEFSGFLVG